MSRLISITLAKKQLGSARVLGDDVKTGSWIQCASCSSALAIRGGPPSWQLQARALRPVAGIGSAKPQHIRAGPRRRRTCHPRPKTPINRLEHCLAGPPSPDTSAALTPTCSRLPPAQASKAHSRPLPARQFLPSRIAAISGPHRNCEPVSNGFPTNMCFWPEYSPKKRRCTLHSIVANSY